MLSFNITENKSNLKYYPYFHLSGFSANIARSVMLNLFEHLTSKIMICKSTTQHVGYRNKFGMTTKQIS